MNQNKIVSTGKAHLVMLLAVFSTVAASLPSVASDTLSAGSAGFVWTGGYIGLQTGHAWGDSNFSMDSDPGYGIGYDPKGLIGGAYAGYNHQIGNLVLGAEADFNFASVSRERAPELYEGEEGNPDHYGTAESKWNGAVRARFGYAMDRILPYVAAGVAFTNYDIALWHVGSDDPHFSKKAALAGWTLGAGIEYAATNNLLVRAEYRYTDYGRETWTDPNWADGNLDVDLRTHDLRLGVAYKF